MLGRASSVTFGVTDSSRDSSVAGRIPNRDLRKTFQFYMGVVGMSFFRFTRSTAVNWFQLVPTRFQYSPCRIELDPNLTAAVNQ